MSAGSILLGLALQAQPGDTAAVRLVESVPADPAPSMAVFGDPSVRIRTGQGIASIWMLRTRDSAFVVALIPDSTFYWGDDLVISLDVSGDRGPVPSHDDFQWYFRRVLDSSVVYRGRAGRWEAPRADPDWRLGPSREGGGWTVRGESTTLGWSLILRLDAAWLDSADPARRPAIAFRVYDDSPGGWFTWPAPTQGRQQSGVERVPDLWGSVGDWVSSGRRHRSRPSFPYAILGTYDAHCRRFAAIGLAILSACQGDPTRPEGGTLRVLVRTTGATLDPDGYSLGVGSSAVALEVQDSLDIRDVPVGSRTMRPDGTEASLLETFRDAAVGEWSPDGREIVAEFAGSAIRRVPLDGGDIITLSVDGADELGRWLR